jgi:uncharacterized radical SAM superfamily Fe-S cluster-containing enzyme
VLYVFFVVHVEHFTAKMLHDVRETTKTENVKQRHSKKLFSVVNHEMQEVTLFLEEVDRCWIMCIFELKSFFWDFFLSL